MVCNMPYYVLKFENSELARLKELELLAEFEVFKDASTFAKGRRAELASDENMIIKVMFADNLQLAEEQIREKREPRPAGEDY